jgi:phenylacetate-coenzyme A ligase PaaK-like adenylate-forming protein
MTPYFDSSFMKRSEYTLDMALRDVPAYSSWRKLDPGRSASIDKRYDSLPHITKADLRFHTWKKFVPEGKNPDYALVSGEITLVPTSGTTEEQVVNAWYQPWWDFSERLSWSYNAHAKHLEYGKVREAILTSSRNTGPVSDERELGISDRTLGRFLYLNEKTSPRLWTDEFMDRMLTELEQFEPAILEANPSYLARLSRYAYNKGKVPYKPNLIILTYENPTPLLRRLIGLSFDTPIASSYGSTEAGYVFMECEQGLFHQNSESCRIDFQPIRKEHGSPDTGRIFVTTFDNPWRVLLRFDIGDIVRLSDLPECECGRNHGLVADAILGRTSNFTFTTEGRALSTLDVENAIYDTRGLAAFSVTQLKTDEYEAAVELLPDTDGKIAIDEIHARLQGLYGKHARIRVSDVNLIETELSGKYRQTRTLFKYDIDSIFA